MYHAGCAHRIKEYVDNPRQSALDFELGLLNYFHGVGLSEIRSPDE
jgi:hypothetical protein